MLSPKIKGPLLQAEYVHHSGFFAPKRSSSKKKVLTEEFIYEVLSVVEEIPEGSVATYGQIARLIGRDKNARLVGRVLRMSGLYGKYPCHRVVNHAGRLVPGWTEQRFLLESEGVALKDDCHVDLGKFLWKDERKLPCTML